MAEVKYITIKRINGFFLVLVLFFMLLNLLQLLEFTRTAWLANFAEKLFRFISWNSRLWVFGFALEPILAVIQVLMVIFIQPYKLKQGLLNICIYLPFWIVKMIVLFICLGATTL